MTEAEAERLRESGGWFFVRKSGKLTPLKMPRDAKRILSGSARGHCELVRIGSVTLSASPNAPKGTIDVAEMIPCSPEAVDEWLSQETEAHAAALRKAREKARSMLEASDG